MIKLILLNVLYIIIKYKTQNRELKKFFMDYLNQSNSKYFKCILFQTLIVTEVVGKGNPPE